ncbi:MAG: PCRF domain-containing protein [Akkermansia sp.]
MSIWKSSSTWAASEIVCRIAGEEVFRFLKYEGGVHRVSAFPHGNVGTILLRHRGRHAGSGGSGHKSARRTSH